MVFPNCQFHSHLFVLFPEFNRHTLFDLFIDCRFLIFQNGFAKYDSLLSEVQLAIPPSPPLLPVLTLPSFPLRYSAPVTAHHCLIKYQNFLATLPSLIHIQHELLGDYWQFLALHAANFELQHV